MNIGRERGRWATAGAKFVLRYLHVEFHRSAFKHGYGEPVILHAVEHALVVVDLDQDGDPPRVLAVGPDTMTSYTTTTGRILTEADIDAVAAEVESAEYDVEVLKTRRRGRPAMGSGPAEVVPVRIDPELKAAIETRAEADHTTASEIIRTALRRFLDVA